MFAIHVPKTTSHLFSRSAVRSRPCLAPLPWFLSPWQSSAPLMQAGLGLDHRRRSCLKEPGPDLLPFHRQHGKEQMFSKFQELDHLQGVRLPGVCTPWATEHRPAGSGVVLKEFSTQHLVITTNWKHKDRGCSPVERTFHT